MGGDAAQHTRRSRDGYHEFRLSGLRYQHGPAILGQRQSRYQRDHIDGLDRNHTPLYIIFCEDSATPVHTRTSFLYVQYFYFQMFSRGSRDRPNIRILAHRSGFARRSLVIARFRWEERAGRTLYRQRSFIVLWVMLRVNYCELIFTFGEVEIAS